MKPIGQEIHAPSWAVMLVDEDWQFIYRFILASGSLKEMAAQYGISYPTVRIRLDRLIEKLSAADKSSSEDRFSVLLRSLVIDGHISQPVAKELLREHRQNKGD
jgi:hypothetical protein